MTLRAEAAALLGVTPTSVTPVHGGDLAEVLRLTLPDGETVIAKSGPAPGVEAEMLQAIAATGTPVPQVIAVNGASLILQDLPDNGVSASAWAHLGQVLAGMHGTHGASYGWSSDYAFGSVAIPNASRKTWPAFWADNRLLPSLPHLPAHTAKRIETLAQRLPDLLPQEPPKSLLHGDLWQGNILSDGTRITGLIDPACYYGDPLVDLAMLTLFGSPAPTFRDTYGPLPDDWPTRQALYQVWPALVHVRLFGAGYLGMLHGLLDRLNA